MDPMDRYWLIYEGNEFAAMTFLQNIVRHLLTGKPFDHADYVAALQVQSAECRLIHQINADAFSRGMAVVEARS